MNIASLIVLALLGCTAIMLSVLLPLAIIFNVRAGQRYRESLARRLDELRLSHMLKALGVDTTAYLHKQRALDIHTHMVRCQTCPNPEICDAALASAAADAHHIGYCNNEQSLIAMLMDAPDLDGTDRPQGIAAKAPAH